MKKHNPLIVLYICVGIISIIFIGISFCQCACASWIIWQSIFLSMGTGFLSAIILSICLAFCEKIHNRRNLAFFTYHISSTILAIYQRLLLLIAETLACEREFELEINNKTLLQITQYIKQKLNMLKTQLAPTTVSQDGESTIEAMCQQEKCSELVKTTQIWIDAIKRCEEQLSNSIEAFEQNKLILLDKYILGEEYEEIVSFSKAFSMTANSDVGGLNIAFDKNINDIVILLEKIDLSLLDLDGQYYYEYVFIGQIKYKPKQKNKATQHRKINKHRK